MTSTTPQAVHKNCPCVLLLAAVLLSMAACSSNRAYDTAFSQQTALQDNSRAYRAPASEVFSSAKISLVQQGFEVDAESAGDGLLKGLRTFDDSKNPKIAYLVTVTLDVTATSPGTTLLTAAASQKTVLNREVHKYYHLLGLLPIPTGREYESVVRAEGNITGAGFYQDLFAAVARNLSVLHGTSPPVAPSAAKPAPLRAVAAAHR